MDAVLCRQWAAGSRVYTVVQVAQQAVGSSQQAMYYVVQAAE